MPPRTIPTRDYEFRHYLPQRINVVSGGIIESGGTLDLHLNLGGGLTGDMFIAAVLDAFPQFEQRVLAAIDAMDGPYPVACSLVAHADYEVRGHRFEIEPFDKYFGYIPIAFSQPRASW